MNFKLEVLHCILKFMIAENNLIFGDSSPGFLHLRTTDILSQIVIWCGAVLCIVGSLAASLASPNQMPVAAPFPSICDDQKYLQILLNIAQRTKLPPLGTTALVYECLYFFSFLFILNQYLILYIHKENLN